jgi:CRISPR/Cas system-associated protein endoribonuclease Cas2
MGHVSVSISMVKIMAENVIVAEVRGLVMTDQDFVEMRTLLGDFYLVEATSTSGDDNTREVHSLNWLWLSITLLKTLF